MEDVDELKKLDPIKRVKKLKELIEQRNKEIEDDQKQLQEKSKELEEAKKLAEKAKKETEELIELRKKISIPEPDDLEEVVQSGEDSLEDRAGPGKQEDGHQYHIPADLPTSQIYSDVAAIYNTAVEKGKITADMAAQAGAIQYAMAKKEEDVEAGNYNPNEEAIAQANSIKTIADKILSMYKDAGGGHNGVHVWQ